jgi:hypothetical protein
VSSLLEIDDALPVNIVPLNAETPDAPGANTYGLGLVFVFVAPADLVANPPSEAIIPPSPVSVTNTSVLFAPSLISILAGIVVVPPITTLDPPASKLTCIVDPEMETVAMPPTLRV